MTSLTSGCTHEVASLPITVTSASWTVRDFRKFTKLSMVLSHLNIWLVKLLSSKKGTLVFLTKLKVEDDGSCSRFIHYLIIKLVGFLS